MTGDIFEPEQVSSAKINPEISETLEGLPKKLENVNPNLLRTLLKKELLYVVLMI